MIKKYKILMSVLLFQLVILSCHSKEKGNIEGNNNQSLETKSQTRSDTKGYNEESQKTEN